ncbi:protein FAM117A, partial [Ornithorhynchus anatinus]|uniref:protein FAM117A n=1 Tax=Ornithorhynchus anatinus TaxID=9258 RepID=UPI0019D4A5D9
GPGGRPGSPRVGGPQPLRATVPFQLHQRRDGAARPAGTPCATAAEKPGCRPLPPRVRRTFSLDTILGSYLLGQWPRDADGPGPCCVNDKATQTPLSWPEMDNEKTSSRAHKRSASWGSTDHRKEVAKLRQQLQRTKLTQSTREKGQSCPLQGDHSVQAAGRMATPGLPSGSPVLRLSPCLHRSLEGLNQELVEAFVTEQGDNQLLRILDVPDGHRAPAPPHGGYGDPALLPLEPGSPSPATARSPPRAPGRATPDGPAGTTEGAVPDAEENDPPPPPPPAPAPPPALPAGGAGGVPGAREPGSPSPVPASASSPRPNHSCVFKREPPEGCEKVQAFEEATSPGPEQAFLPSCPDKNKVHFNPTGSAFCPVSLGRPPSRGAGFLFRGGPGPGPGAFLAAPRTDPEPPALARPPWQRPPQAEDAALFHSSLVV